MKAFIPDGISKTESLNYEFDQDDVLEMTHSSLEILFHKKDSYFKQMAINFAKMIYQLVGEVWSDEADKQNKISLKKLKRTII